LCASTLVNRPLALLNFHAADAPIYRDFAGRQLLLLPAREGATA